ncbi:MAG: HPr(Ser) kinase/phosphatase [Erysipelotrichaceae bacterium]|nr:HPr(Ser) kinase/phosphatase [Erysipelotrichaceae bacterium]
MANEELNKRVYVHELKKGLNLEQVTGNEESLNRWIIAPDINRPGLELSGYLESNDLKRVVVLGKKEQEYMAKLDPVIQKQRFEIITDSYTPCIILSRGFTGNDVLYSLARDRNFPIFKYTGETYQLIVDAVAFLSERLALGDIMHGVMMNIYGKGVMLLGKSGIGKSELALDLIQRGHMLVADDRIDYKRINERIVCEAPASLKMMLEIRGLGVVNITRLYGAKAFLNKCDLDFVIRLVKYDEKEEYNRINQANDNIDFLGLHIPVLTIPITEGKALSVIIETAVTEYILMRQQGIDPNEEFRERIMQEIKKNGADND